LPRLPCVETRGYQQAVANATLRRLAAGVPASGTSIVGSTHSASGCPFHAPSPLLPRTGFDRFGRIKHNRWYSYGQNEDVDRVKYGCDRAGNRIWRENVVAREQYNKPFDEIYAYDGLHRLIDFRRGWLNDARDDLIQMTFRQSWSLDATGNWSEFREDSDGDGTWDLVQQRTCNPVNEITQITTTTGPAWATPQYDRNGNMTVIPKPADPTQTFTATYDPWNRLVKLVDSAIGTPVAEYSYDARHRRIIKRTYDDAGNLSEVRHFYFTDQWQDIEERVTYSGNGSEGAPGSASAGPQHVWGLRSIDDHISRRAGSGNAGGITEASFSLQDAIWSLTSTADKDVSILGRRTYNAYGSRHALTGDFLPAAEEQILSPVSFAGYYGDHRSELYVARHRRLHPIFGCWVRRDPEGYVDSPNLYEYVRSNPCGRGDPLGLGCWIRYKCRSIADVVRSCVRYCLYECTEKNALGKGRQDVAGGPLTCKQVRPIGKHKIYQSRQYVGWKVLGCCIKAPRKCEDLDDARIWWSKGDLPAARNCSQKECWRHCRQGKVFGKLCSLLGTPWKLACKAAFIVGGHVCESFCQAWYRRP